MWALTTSIIRIPSNIRPWFPTNLARVTSGVKSRALPWFCKWWSLMYLQMRFEIWPLEALGLPMTAWRSALTWYSLVIFFHPGCALLWKRLFFCLNLAPALTRDRILFLILWSLEYWRRRWTLARRLTWFAIFFFGADLVHVQQLRYFFGLCSFPETRPS